MTSAAPALSVCGLEVSYRHRSVLRGLDLEIEGGTIYGLLGPNGAGKTTLIRSICGRVRPDAGSIAVAGRDNRDRAALRRIGLVPQEIALYGHLTIRENLETVARLSGLDAGEAEAALAWVREIGGLGQRWNERTEILSGGWKRRVNIAAAVLHRPGLLILDEPTVGVDIDARNDLQAVIVGLSAGGMGVLLATHDLDQAETICTKVGFLRQGVIDPQGPPRDLVDEQFGASSEVIVELRTPLAEEQSGVLGRAGFVPSNAGMTWSILDDTGAESVGDLAQRLELVGIRAREVRLRRPGLDTLFVRLSQDAPTPGTGT